MGTGLRVWINQPFTPKEFTITWYPVRHALLMMPRIREISARTINIWINPPTLYTNTPKSQPMIRITAIR